jgi:mRNA interferase MazF
MFEAGELVMLPFPFSDLSSTKRRPVLVLTVPDKQDDFVACPVTSRAGWLNARHLAPEDLAAGALPLPS